MARPRKDTVTERIEIETPAEAKPETVTVQIRGNVMVNQMWFSGVKTFRKDDPMLAALAGEYTVIEG